MSVQFDGADSLKRLEQSLAKASQDIDRTIQKAVESELAPLPKEVAASAMRILPRRGGLSQLVASRVVPKQKRGPGSVEVFAVGRQGLKELKRLDRGQVRHPVHARRSKSRAQWKWVNQTVNKRFWSRPVELRADEIKKAVKAALDELARKI